MERDLRREIYEKAKRFEERVAELFALQGFRTIVDYKRDDMQFDVRLEMASGALPIYALVECKDLGETVTQRQVREFASKVEDARDTEKKPYQAIMVSRSGFANNAHVMAENKFVRLLTFQELLLSLVDLGPNLESAIRNFEGTSLQRLYVEQEAVLEANIRLGEPLEPKGLTETVRDWVDRPGSTFLALLGDFGCGKTSFCKRLAWELAAESKEKPGEIRMPILIDLREGGSTTVTLENLLTHHFQRLSNQAFNPQALLHLNREGYLLLIFDGFDETIAYTEPGRYLENLRQILRAAEGKAKVLLTCRTHYFRDRPEVLKRLGRAPEMVSSLGATKLYEEIQERAGAEVGYVLEFREPQIEQYLQKALPEPANWRAFREQIRHTYNLEELAERPFLLEIIVKTLPRLLERGSAVTLADLYETYCESWFAHTDFRLTLTRDNKVELVEYLACLIWNSPENRVHYTVLADKAAEFFKDRPLTAYDKERIDYEVRTALFVHRDSEGHYSFIHRSFLEFFIARTLRAGLAADDSDCLSLRRLTREVVFFLEFWPEAKRIPQVAGHVLEARYELGVSENALLLLYFHARSALGPLVGPGEEAEPDLTQVRKVFTEMRPKALNLRGANLTEATFPGIDLSGADLRYCNFSRADLRKASLNRMQAANACFEFANLSGASAENSILKDSNLRHIRASEASFQKSDLRNSDMTFANLRKANLLEATTDGTLTTGAGFLNAQVPSAIQLSDTAGKPNTSKFEVQIQMGHRTTVRHVSWSPTSDCLATTSDDGKIKLWDPESGSLVNSLDGHDNQVFAAAWSPDGHKLASASADQTVKIWDTAKGVLLDTLSGHSDKVISVSWATDDSAIASASADATICLWNPVDGKHVKRFLDHKDWIDCIVWSPDNKKLASASRDRTVIIWDIKTGRRLLRLGPLDYPIYSVTWSPGGDKLASLHTSEAVARIWGAESGKLITTIKIHEDQAHSIIWTPDGLSIVTADYEAIYIWNIGTGLLSREFRNSYRRSRCALSWSPDKQYLACAAFSDPVEIWRIDKAVLEIEIEASGRHLTSIAWDPSKKRLALAGDNGDISIWDRAIAYPVPTSDAYLAWVTSLAWSPNGNLLASSSNSIIVWETKEFKPVWSFEDFDHFISMLTWSPDGQTLASLSESNEIHLWDAATGDHLRTIQERDHHTISIGWNFNGTRIASISTLGFLQIWTKVSGRRTKALHLQSGLIHAAAWAPNGRQLALASNENPIGIWDYSSGRFIRMLQGEDALTSSLAWSPDGHRLAAASVSMLIEIWDVTTGVRLACFKVSDAVKALTWSSDSSQLAVALENFAEIWNVELGSPHSLGRLHQTPNGMILAVTPDGYFSGFPQAYEYIRFSDGWALYDPTDLPERFSLERVAAAFNPEWKMPSTTHPRKARRKS